METVMLAKDGGSGEDGCPSVYLQDGALVVQGPAADLGTLQHVLDGEVAARISVDVVRDALAAYDARRP